MIEKFFTFPTYTYNGTDGDIALLKLASDLPLADASKNLGTICLPEENEDMSELEGKEATVSGWGDLKFSMYCLTTTLPYNINSMLI